MERGKKSYLTQKDAIFEVLYAIGGVDIYRTPESNSNLSYTIISYVYSYGEYYESEITIDNRCNLVSVVETKHFH